MQVKSEILSFKVEILVPRTPVSEHANQSLRFFLELAQVHSSLWGKFLWTQSAKMENASQNHQITTYVHSKQISLEPGCSAQFPVLQISKPVQLLSHTVQTHKAAGNNFTYFKIHC